VASQSLGGEHADTGDTAVSGVLLLRDLCQVSLFPSTRDARGACANKLKNPHAERGTAMWEVISDTMGKAMAHRKAGEAKSGQRASAQRGSSPRTARNSAGRWPSAGRPSSILRHRSSPACRWLMERWPSETCCGWSVGLCGPGNGQGKHNRGSAGEAPAL
jgi:hypothetical protein